MPQFWRNRREEEWEKAMQVIRDSRRTISAMRRLNERQKREAAKTQDEQQKYRESLKEVGTGNFLEDLMFPTKRKDKHC